MWHSLTIHCVFYFLQSSFALPRTRCLPRIGSLSSKMCPTHRQRCLAWKIMGTGCSFGWRPSQISDKRPSTGGGPARTAVACWSCWSSQNPMGVWGYIACKRLLTWWQIDLNWSVFYGDLFGPSQSWDLGWSISLSNLFPRNSMQGPLFWSMSNVWLWRFPKIGVRHLSSIFVWDFPWNKPSSYWGIPIYGKPHYSNYRTMVLGRHFWSGRRFRFKQAPTEEFMRLRINGRELRDRRQRVMATPVIFGFDAFGGWESSIYQHSEIIRPLFDVIWCDLCDYLFGFPVNCGMTTSLLAHAQLIHVWGDSVHVRKAKKMVLDLLDEPGKSMESMGHSGMVFCLVLSFHIRRFPES